MIEEFKPSKDWVNQLNSIHKDLQITTERRTIQGINGFKVDSWWGISNMKIPYLNKRFLSFNLAITSVSATNNEEFKDYDCGIVSGDALPNWHEIPAVCWQTASSMMANLTEDGHLHINTCGHKLNVGDQINVHAFIEVTI